LDAVIPGGSVLGVMAAVCLNGYLVGGPIETIVNYPRRRRQSATIAGYLRLAGSDHLGSPGY
jgi:hypothetical protein